MRGTARVVLVVADFLVLDEETVWPLSATHCSDHARGSLVATAAWDGKEYSCGIRPHHPHDQYHSSHSSAAIGGTVPRCWIGILNHSAAIAHVVV